MDDPVVRRPSPGIARSYCFSSVTFNVVVAPTPTVKVLSQGAMEKRTGLMRRYVSRVENNHTIRAIETPGKMARALEIPV